MDHEEIRLDCLRLADQPGEHTEIVVNRARKYADLVLGTKDAEVIQAAGEFAKKVGNA